MSSNAGHMSSVTVIVTSAVLPSLSEGLIARSVPGLRNEAGRPVRRTLPAVGDLLGLIILLAVAGALLIVLLTAMLVRAACRPARRTAAYAVAHALPCDPGDVGLDFEAWTVNVRGGTLPVWSIESPAASHDATAVILHGWGQSRINMLSRIEPWARWCRRLVLYDLRGHGEADAGASRLGPDEEDDLLRIIERVADGKPILLAGHSMGAGIAARAAATGAIDGLAGLIAYGPYVHFRTSLIGQLRRRHLPALPLVDLGLAWLRLRGMHHRSLADAAVALPCPLQVLHGEEDDIAPPQDGRLLADAAPDGRYASIPGAGHGDIAEVAADQHDGVVHAFIEHVLSAEPQSP